LNGERWSRQTFPAYTPTGTVSTGTAAINEAQLNVSAGGNAVYARLLGIGSTLVVSGMTFTGTAQGGTSTPFSIQPPSMLATIYLKL
jgi:hypothetical protein